MNLQHILKQLNAAGIEYVVVGGIAANAHGSARVTLDVDICYDPSPGNVERLVTLLNGWRAYLRGVEPGLPWVLDSRTFRDTPVMTLATDHGAFDLMDSVAGVGPYEQVAAASQAVTVLGVSVRVLGLDALIAAKRAAGRRKDLESLLELEALRELRRRATS